MPLLILSCTSRETGSVSEASDTALIISDTTSQVSSLETFTDLPPAIEGCSGLFSAAYDTSKGNYIFVTDLQGKAWIKVNGTLLQLTRVSRNNKDSLIRETYKSENLTIAFTALLWQQIGDEVWLYEGDIFVSDGKEFDHILLTGEVGC